MPGGPVADAVFADLIPRSEKLIAAGHTPGLGTILVGDDGASARYVGMKMEKARELGWSAPHQHLPEDATGEDITYRELLERASAVAAGLQAKGLRREETVAIMLPTCADFFYAFFGVMLAGGIAVPIYPPARPDKIDVFYKVVDPATGKTVYKDSANFTNQTGQTFDRMPRSDMSGY